MFRIAKGIYIFIKFILLMHKHVNNYKKNIFRFIEIIPKFYKKLKMAEQRGARLSAETKRRILAIRKEERSLGKIRNVLCSRYSLGSKVFVKNGGRHFHYRASLPISASLLTHKLELSLLLGTNYTQAHDRSRGCVMTYFVVCKCFVSAIKTNG